MTEPILVSACLLGFPCRYDGASKPCAPLKDLYVRGFAIPICPESLSGLPVPRPPCEQCGDRILSKTGEDVTAAFVNGAARALQKARASGVKHAVLKANSPSCGVNFIYDGSFTGRLVRGNGIFTRLLLSEGWTVQDEKEFMATQKTLSAKSEITKIFIGI